MSFQTVLLLAKILLIALIWGLIVFLDQSTKCLYNCVLCEWLKFKHLTLRIDIEKMKNHLNIDKFVLNKNNFLGPYKCEIKKFEYFIMKIKRKSVYRCILLQAKVVYFCGRCTLESRKFQEVRVQICKFTNLQGSYPRLPQSFYPFHSILFFHFFQWKILRNTPFLT